MTKTVRQAIEHRKVVREHCRVLDHVSEVAGREPRAAAHRALAEEGHKELHRTGERASVPADCLESKLAVDDESVLRAQREHQQREGEPGVSRPREVRPKRDDPRVTKRLENLERERVLILLLSRTGGQDERSQREVTFQ